MTAMIRILGAARALLVLAVLLPRTDTATWERCKRKYDRREILVPNQTLVSNDTVLELNNCQLTEIHVNDFNISMPNLMAIYFINNNLRNVDPVVFRGFPDVRAVYLDQNNLTEVPVFGEASVLPNVVMLAISNNQIIALENPKTFSSAQKLRTLTLADNQIAHINPEFFQGLANLKTIWLSDNKLTYIADKTFAIPSLNFIKLNNNLIEYIAPGAFRGTRLRYLYLSNNQLTQLPENFVSDLTSTGGNLYHCRFENNPFQCACLSELLTEVKHTRAEESDKCDYGAEHYTEKSAMCELKNDSQQCRRLTEAEYVSQRSTRRN